MPSLRAIHVIAPRLIAAAALAFAAALPLSAAHAETRRAYPLILTMDTAHIDAGTATTVGDIVFPDHHKMVKSLADWASTLKGLEVKVTLAVTDDTLVFTPNNLMDAMTMGGLKVVTIPTRDVIEIDEITSGLNGYKHLVVETKEGVLVFHLDPDSLTLLFADFYQARDAMTRTLTQVCPQAVFHQLRPRD